MKKCYLVAIIALACTATYAGSKIDTLSENSFYSNIFTSFYYLDNADLNNSLAYWQKASDVSKKIEIKRIKSYAFAFRALWFQKRFPEAKDIIGRETNLTDAISNLDSEIKKNKLDEMMLQLLRKLKDDRFYNLPPDVFIETYKKILEEKVGPSTEFMLYFLKYFSREDGFLKYIDDYTYFIGADLVSRARHHANIALTILGHSPADSYYLINPAFHLKKALYYYKKASLFANGDSSLDYDSEMKILTENLKNIVSDYYTKSLGDNSLQQYKIFQASFPDSLKYQDYNFCDGTPYAAVEIGASGVKLSIICLKVISINNEVNYEYQILKTGSYDANFGNLNTVNLNKTYDAVKNFCDTIKALYHIPETQIFIAFSSGAVNETIKQKRPGVMDSLKARFYNTHIFLDNSKISVTEMKVNDEARLTLLGIVTSDIRTLIYTAGIFDIGTGNVKGGFCNDNSCNAFNFPFIESNWGLGEIMKHLPPNPDFSNISNVRQYADTAEKLIKKIVRDDIGSQLISTGLRDKKQIFTTGGIFWAIASLTHPVEVIVDKKNYVAITESDVRAFKTIATDNYPIDPVGNIPEINKGIREVTQTFSQAKSIVGSILALQILLEFNKSSQKPKKYYYSKFSLVGWPSGLIVRAQND